MAKAAFFDRWQILGVCGRLKFFFGGIFRAARASNHLTQPAILDVDFGQARVEWSAAVTAFPHRTDH
jgi:hypothetical protein